MTAEQRKIKNKPAEIPLRPLLLQPWFHVAAVVLVVLLFATYWNHFHNPFEFDDAHTIENNLAIRDLHNIPEFFTDATTSSTLPANQAFRPGLTTLNAIDTWISGGTPDAFWFHVDIFFTYIILGVLLFFFLLHIFRKTFPASSYTHWAALTGTGFFWLHTANAETINYIISRDDSFSTMMVLLAFVLFFYSASARKYLLFLIPVVVGFFVKEPTIMFAPLLLAYVLIFGDPDKKTMRMILGIGIAFLLAGVLFVLSQIMTPQLHTYGGGGRFQYLYTQFFVILHYFGNFILPNSLSADSDWMLIASPLDVRVIAGAIFICVMLLIALFTSQKKETKPVAFGILWFFIALAPTSSIFPLAEVLNDHRPFFAYIGLVLAFVNCALLLLKKSEEKKRFTTLKYSLGIFSIVLLGCHAYGTIQRNIVWHSPASLWKDATEKSPGNGRAWMNYGLSQMNAARTGDHNYVAADSSLSRALRLLPRYSYAWINMGVLRENEGREDDAGSYYKTAIDCDAKNPECYYYYGLYLLKTGRYDEAKNTLQQGHTLSPQHTGINAALAPFYNGQIKSPVETAEDAVAKNPNVDNYINLSLACYRSSDFAKSADAAAKAAQLDSTNGTAWNNLCAAYDAMGEFEKAVAAGKKAITIQPNDQLSQNNYRDAQTKQLSFQSLEEDARKKSGADAVNAWISLSLQWYNAHNYRKSVDACNEAIKLSPANSTAWNNLCAAENMLGEWDKAIAAGEQALKIDPNSQLAKNNLQVSKTGKAGVR